MKILSIVAFVLLIWAMKIILVGCTYSINMAHTEGVASDLIDETQSATPDISPNIDIPAL